MNDRHQGILVGPREAGRQPETRINEAGLRAGTPPDGAAAMSVPYGLPFAGLFFYTVLIYVRPQELFPGLFGSFPLVKIVAIATLLVYFFASVSAGRRLTVWPIELKVVLFIAFLCILFTPIAAAPQDSLDGLFETFLKVVIMFVVTINVLNTRERLRSIMALSVICGTFLAWLAISNYSEGNFYMTKSGRSTGRIAGAVDEGLFGNPNDLATGLLLLLPFAVAFALTNRGSKRVLYIAGAILMTVGIVVTFSRGGFLGLVGVGVVLLWKLSKRRRGLSILAFSVVTGIFLVAMPGGYAGRLTTIVSIDDDPTGSAQARRELLKRATAVAANHPVIGVGMKNFHIYSIQEQVAHNSFLEIAAELGLAGLLAFLILIFSPLRGRTRRLPFTVQT